MKLHEYQSKALLREAGLPVPKGEVAFSATESLRVIKALGLETGVIKAQAYTGGRGKAGGVKLFKDVHQGAEYANDIIGMTLITHQTGPAGVHVNSVLVEEASQIKKELYLAITLDRAKVSPVIMISPEGGMDIEEVAENTPDKILKLYPEFNSELSDELCNEGAEFLMLGNDLKPQFADVLRKLYKLYIKRDCSLLEINPLIVNSNNELVLLDCKFDIDDNAAYRQMDTGGNPDGDKTPAETKAAEYKLSYIELDGTIGCMVNGAGLAMATMDSILHYGGSPANFLDVGGSANEEAVAKAFEIITSDNAVKAILVNIFGGIMKCDTIASGIINAVKKTGLEIPLVVRLEGTNVEQGKQLIYNSGLNIISADNLADGATKAVAAANQ